MRSQSQLLNRHKHAMCERLLEIVLDSNVLVDFLAQFYGNACYGRESFVEQDCISRELARRLNRIVRQNELDRLGDLRAEGQVGQIVASAFAFVEIARKWVPMVRNRFTVDQMAAFLEQPPDWFVIEPLDDNLLRAFCDVPAEVVLGGGQWKSIEWADAVHVATAFGRGGHCLLATTDRSLFRIQSLHQRLI